MPIDVSEDMSWVTSWIGQAAGARLLSLSQPVALSSCDCSAYDCGRRERIEGVDSVGDCVMFRAFVRRAGADGVHDRSLLCGRRSEDRIL